MSGSRRELRADPKCAKELEASVEEFLASSRNSRIFVYNLLLAPMFARTQLMSIYIIYMYRFCHIYVYM